MKINMASKAKTKVHRVVTHTSQRESRVADWVRREVRDIKTQLEAQTTNGRMNRKLLVGALRLLLEGQTIKIQ